MVVEIMDESQEWPINLPPEPERNREIVASDDGGVVSRWRWSTTYDAWRSPGSFASTWAAVVMEAMSKDLSLRSVPIVDLDPIDAGTAAMVAKQIESHITLPAFIQESCQFENVTDGGKEEWRAIFRAALEAYKAAGGAT